MSTENIIEIGQPQIILGRQAERIHQLKEYVAETNDGSMHMYAIAHAIDKILALGMELQTSIDSHMRVQRAKEMEGDNG